MLYLCTLFDQQHDGRPLITGLYDSGKRSLEFFNLYIKGTSRSVYDIEQDMATIGQKIESAKSVMLNDYKQHLMAFPHNYPATPKTFDIPLPQLPIKPNIKFCRKVIHKVLSKMKNIRPQYWHAVRARAAVVYKDLQERGVLYYDKLHHPQWGWAWSGRSKTTGFNVQGLSSDDLTNPNGDKIFVNFDWVAADMRAIAIMSGDPKLNYSFTCSDPYQYMVDHFNDGVLDNDKLSRAEGKNSLFASVYSLDADNPALDFYGGFREWIVDCRKRLHSKRHLDSILKRRFRMQEKRGERSVFNATIQGSVAHAMQICLRRVWDIYPDNVLTENHDSLVVTCQKDDLKTIIQEVVKIMICPFNGILNTNPQFPVKVSVGLKYKQWQEHKRFNEYGQIG